jgi:hypothetical protein
MTKLFWTKNVHFEHIRKVKTINSLYNYNIYFLKMGMFTFSELSSMSFYLYNLAKDV